MKSAKVTLIGIGLSILGASAMLGYVVKSYRWPSGNIVMHLQLGSSGTLLDGSTSWGKSVEDPMARWNAVVTAVQFKVVRDSTSSKADGNGINNVFWSSTAYGKSFGSTTLAVTTTWLKNGWRTEADVIFNTAKPWNSYTGNLKTASGGGTLNDIRRVALHEFGHVLGLDHPDEIGQSVSAIMNSRESNTYTLQTDDINGAQYLYSSAFPTPTPKPTPRPTPVPAPPPSTGGGSGGGGGGSGGTSDSVFKTRYAKLQKQLKAVKRIRNPRVRAARTKAIKKKIYYLLVGYGYIQF